MEGRNPGRQGWTDAPAPQRLSAALQLQMPVGGLCAVPSVSGPSCMTGCSSGRCPADSTICVWMECWNSPGVAGITRSGAMPPCCALCKTKVHLCRVQCRPLLHALQSTYFTTLITFSMPPWHVTPHAAQPRSWACSGRALQWMRQPRTRRSCGQHRRALHPAPLKLGIRRQSELCRTRGCAAQTLHAPRKDCARCRGRRAAALQACSTTTTTSRSGAAP